MTLSSAYVALNSCFANGQVYVALSRLQSLEGLHILGSNFNKNSIRAAGVCLDFYGLRSKTSQTQKAPPRKNKAVGKFASIAGKFQKKFKQKSNPLASFHTKPKRSPNPVFGRKKSKTPTMAKPVKPVKFGENIIAND
eukprot:UN16632